MPELPEVETTRRGIAPAVEGRRILAMTVRDPRLRWPVPDNLAAQVSGALITRVERRAKYLLLHTALPAGPGPAVPDDGALLVHLGMSGALRVVTADTPLRKHDHVDWQLDSGAVLRFHDPRRFGCVLWQPLGTTHPLLARLGPEPLSPDFDGTWLRALAQGRTMAVKPFLMDQAVVVGVGNIYATEALFRAGIHPRRPAGRVSAARYAALAAAVKAVLAESIARGGTTLRDYVDPQGSPGWFALQLAAYERAGAPCVRCATPIRRVVLAQRASYYCPRCQR
ncbi:MAG: bifunctional DNA-formamidopyrimidine glycosylase/DNA-(apurinic or apyrimidinic site) lyase [Oceanococcaceae bacterium]